MTVNSAPNYILDFQQVQIQLIKYIITCNETQDKVANFRVKTLTKVGVIAS